MPIIIIYLNNGNIIKKYSNFENKIAIQQTIIPLKNNI